MKRKIITLVFLLVILVGCTLTSPTTSPKRAVENLFGDYQSLDNKVLAQLNNVITGEKLTDAQKTEYENLIRKQYQNLVYNIKEEVVDGDTAVVTVEIEVYDFAKANRETEVYVSEHADEFMGADDSFDDVSYQDYKIAKLKEVSDRIKYTLDLGLTKTDDKWELDSLSDMERQKIHGLYNL